MHDIFHQNEWTALSSNGKRAKELTNLYKTVYPDFLEYLRFLINTDKISYFTYYKYEKMYLDKHEA